ncbi:MAG: hypothetical protein ACR2OM_09900 [Aestuariivirgaceae bacterium]
MRNQSHSNQALTQTDTFEDQYRRPACRPVESTEELERLLGPGTKQLLQLLNNM